jgi:phosphoribosylaminoimidazole carboxylase (NCAIR synthetase)
MENQLAHLFKEWGNRTEKIDLPDLKLKDAVFSTIDATSLVADIVDLFTVKFVQAQAEVLDAVPENEFGARQDERVFQFLQKKFNEKNLLKDIENE